MAKKCQHKPDWSTIRHADGTTDDESVVDVWCKVCKQSGSMFLEAREIDWGDWGG